MRNIPDKFVEKMKTSTLCLTAVFYNNRAVCEKVWKNMAEPDMP